MNRQSKRAVLDLFQPAQTERDKQQEIRAIRPGRAQKDIARITLFM